MYKRLNVSASFVAGKYIGQAEKPNNSGFHDASFEEKMRRAGFSPHDPWCLWFVRMCFLEAANGDVSAENIIKSVIHGSAVNTWKSADDPRTSGFCVQTSRPTIDTIAIWQQCGHWTGHGGIVDELGEEGDFWTVEGNTNASKGRAGDRVWRHRHKAAEINRTSGLKLLGFLEIRFPEGE